MSEKLYEVLIALDGEIVVRNDAAIACAAAGSERYANLHSADEKILRKVRDAVANLINAAVRANGEHSAPHDCYATGPLTGNDFLDLVSCPGCELAKAIAAVEKLS